MFVLSLLFIINCLLSISIPFIHPLFLEEVNNELKSYRKEVEDLTASCGVTSLEEVMTDTDNT